MITKHTDCAVIIFRRANEEIIKDELGVIAAQRGLIYGRFALGEKTGEQDRAFYLSAGDGRTVMDAAQRTSLDAKRRCVLGPFRHNVRAHFSKRRNHAIHRAPRERSVTDKAAFKGLTGEESS